ncbi:hypothetical protein EXIGLDRAFT_838099 [Exidia glandulosa HHB12029]|uniref:Uncharacterized protein n=1 Tax=Exidia glandulosa HHB12029 TaxID=1314781 RepID=A0A165G741_EXIGL|nr:hypothetical protein EXIGLDRAFT_838099 [Exidia glandulosa HHB12029]
MPVNHAQHPLFHVPWATSSIAKLGVRTTFAVAIVGGKTSRLQHCPETRNIVSDWLAHWSSAISFNMGQYWQIVNLDKRTAHAIGKLGEGIYTLRLTRDYKKGYKILSSHEITQLLYIRHESRKDPRAPWQRQDRSATESPPPHVPPPHHQTDSPLFGKLPLELIEMIFTANDDEWETTVCLALTCRRAWDIGAAKFFKEHLDPYYGSWNGDRLIILGDYARFDDLPEGVFDDEEADLIDRALDAIQRNNWDPRDCADRITVDQDFVGNLCSSPRDPLVHGLDLVEFTYPLMHLSPRAIFNDGIKGEIPWYRAPIPSSDLVLRNLSTKEYVSGEEFERTLAAAQAKGWFVPWTLGDLLALRICWSSDTGAALTYENNITRGAWAGHSFDIVPKDTLPAGEVLPEWKDASGAILADAWKFFELDHLHRDSSHPCCRQSPSYSDSESDV